MEEDHLYQIVFPIVQDEGSGRISVAGTSVLVEHRGLPFLVTAAHVFRNNLKQYPLYLSLKKEAIPLPLPSHMTPKPIGPNDDDLDLAFFNLRTYGDLANSLIGYGTVSLEDPPVEPPCARQHFLVFGYPWRRASYHRKDNLINIRPLRYFTDIDNKDKTFIKYKLKKESHLIVRYRRKQTINQKRQRVTARKPHGVSGGPLFRVLVDDQDVGIVLILEGILTDWLGREVIVATRKSSLRDYIDSCY